MAACGVGTHQDLQCRRQCVRPCTNYGSSIIRATRRLCLLRSRHRKQPRHSPLASEGHLWAMHRAWPDPDWSSHSSLKRLLPTCSALPSQVQDVRSQSTPAPASGIPSLDEKSAALDCSKEVSTSVPAACTVKPAQQRSRGASCWCRTPGHQPRGIYGSRPVPTYAIDLSTVAPVAPVRFAGCSVGGD